MWWRLGLMVRSRIVSERAARDARFFAAISERTPVRLRCEWRAAKPIEVIATAASTTADTANTQSSAYNPVMKPPPQQGSTILHIVRKVLPSLRAAILPRETDQKLKRQPGREWWGQR